MKTRTFLAYTHLLNFLTGVFASGYVLNIFWNSLENWQITLYIYYLVLGICGVAIAYWIALDGKRIERYALNIQDLERRILDLERKIDHIKTGATKQP